MAYADCIQAFVNNPTWAEQIELSKTKDFALSYIFLKEEKKDSANIANTTKSILNSHRTVINNTYTPQGLESLAIQYSVNQPADPQL